MKGKIALALALALAPAVSSAESIAEKTGVNSMLGMAPKTADFVSEAASSDMFELAAAKLALEKGDASEKQFAQDMIRDHTKTTEELKGLVASGAVEATLPSEIDSAMQKKLDKLNGATGEAFTRDYARGQVSAHESAVSLFERYGKSGDNEKLRTWAEATLPALRHHLEMAKALREGAS